MTEPKTYDVRTYGCQMNVHDSERLAGLLEAAGYVDLASIPAAQRAEVADVVVFNTCAVRENADNKLYGNLGQLRPAKTANPGMQIAVGGCLAQKDRATIVERAPWVDVVFGTHNIGSLPALLDRARHNKRAEVEILESLEIFPSTLPTRRDSAYAGWVSISVGCNNTCTFCIVPSLRGKEQDRRPGEILAEVEALVAQGVVEVTLLGQNVNTYGVEFGDRLAFGKLLRACGDIDGLERVRFTSPHPAAFTDDVIAAMAETPNVMPSLHMPLQSGSDRVLKAMRRSYRSEHFLGIIDEVRAAIPDAAITTDLIVGFPGETEADFAETLRVVGPRASRAPSRSSTPSAPARPPRRCPTRCPRRWSRSATTGSSSCRSGCPGPRTARVEGRDVEVLVAPGEGRKDGATARPLRPGPRQPARALRRARTAPAPASGRRRRRGCHLRRAAPPRRRQRGERWGLRRAAHPGRGRVGGTAGCRGAGEAGRGARDAVGRTAGAGGGRGPRLRDLSQLRKNAAPAASATRSVATTPVNRGLRFSLWFGWCLSRRGERAAAYSGVGSNGSRLSGGSPERAWDTGFPFRQGRESASNLGITRCPGQPNGATLAERPRPPTKWSGASVASSEDQGSPMAPSAFTCAWSTCSAYLPPVALSTASPPRSMAWSLSCSTWSGWSPASS